MQFIAAARLQHTKEVMEARLKYHHNGRSQADTLTSRSPFHDKAQHLRCTASARRHLAAAKQHISFGSPRTRTEFPRTSPTAAAVQDAAGHALPGDQKPQVGVLVNCFHGRPRCMQISIVAVELPCEMQAWSRVHLHAGRLHEDSDHGRPYEWIVHSSW
jgi:hypothetical protein